MSKIKLSINATHLNILVESLEMRFDMDSDMVLDDVWIGANTESVNREQLTEMRKLADKRIGDLIELQALLLHLKAAQ